MKHLKIIASVIGLSILLALSACGGGGDGGDGSSSSAAPTFTPKFAYAASTNSDKVLGYTVDPTSGQLTAMGFLGEFLAGDAPVSVAVHPSGNFIYAANSGSDTVTGYTVLSNGLLLFVQGVPNGEFPTGTSPQSVTVDPSGRFLYVANLGGLPTDPRGVSAYTIDITTGALTEITGSPFTLLRSRSVTVDPSGKFAYVVATSGVQALTIDAGTGALTAVGGAVGAGGTPQSITVDPSGKFAYVPNQTSDTVSGYTIDATSGALTRIDADANPANGIDDFPALGAPRSVAVHPNGKFAYVAASVGFVQAYAIDATTGALADIFVAGGDCSTVPGGQCLTGDDPRFVSVDRGGKFVYVTNFGTDDVSTYTIDAATGALTEIPTGRVLAGDGPSAIGIVGTTP